VDIVGAGSAASGERSGARDIAPRIGGEEIPEVAAIQ
jgi:hypothetical protein